MNYKCLDCNAEFNEQDQTNQDHRNGICPCCGSENIKELPFPNLEAGDLVRLTFDSSGKLGMIEKY